VYIKKVEIRSDRFARKWKGNRASFNNLIASTSLIKPNKRSSDLKELFSGPFDGLPFVVSLTFQF